MKYFFKLLFSLLFAGSAFFPAFAADSPRMCYFQLTSASRSGASGDEAAGLKGTFKLGDSGALISYFGRENESDMTQTAFENMVKDNKQCNALVLSGYYTGDFHSDNPERGPLDLTLIETLSCDPKYKDWFANVEGIILHGTRTVNDKYIEGVKKNPQSATQNKGDKDSLTDKLIGEEEKIGVNEETSRTVRDVNYSYAHTLDEHNPLSSRYLRGFPNAHIYAFSEDAGLGEGDEDIKRHIAKVLGALGEDNKVKEEFKNTENFVSAISKITADECDGEKWAEDPGKEFIQKKESAKYKKAKDLGCQLINAKQVLSGEKAGDKEKAKKSITEALKKIVKDKTLSHLLLNNITDTLQFAENKMDDADFLKDTKDILKGGKFKTALEEKIDSPILPSLRKIDYIQLYKKLGGDAGDAVRGLFQRVISTSNQTNKKEKTLYILMADKLSQYKLLSSFQMDMIRKNGALFPDNGTDWQKNMKIRLTYRSYATQKTADHDFIRSLQANVGNKAYVSVVTAEVLRNKDLETAFLAADALAPENYEEISPSNNKFILRFRDHIKGAPSQEARSKMVTDYLERSKAASDDPNIKGKTHFQASLLIALREIGEDEFSVFFQQSKKEFFKSLESQKQNLNGPAKGVFTSIGSGLGV